MDPQRRRRKQGALERRRRDALFWARQATNHRERGNKEVAAHCEHKARIAKTDVQRLEAKLGEMK